MTSQALLNSFEGAGQPFHARLTWGRSPSADRLEPVLDLAVHLAPCRTKSTSLPVSKLERVPFFSYNITSVLCKVCFREAVFLPIEAFFGLKYIELIKHDLDR